MPYYTDKFNLTDYSVHFKKGMTLQYGLVMYLPLFLIGVIFSDIEHLSKGFGRPLDALRNINFWVKIPINLVFLTIFVVYGSQTESSTCASKEVDDPDACLFHKAVTFNTIDKLPWKYLGAVSGFVFALTSEYF